MRLLDKISAHFDKWVLAYVLLCLIIDMLLPKMG